MKNCVLIIFIFTILFSLSCKKTPDRINISGKAVDASTNAPLANAYLAVGKYESTVNGIGITKISDCYTDAGGNYSFDFKYEVGNEYHIVGKKDKYFDTNIYDDNKIPSQGSITNFNIRFTAKAYANIIIDKVDPSYNGLQLDIETLGSTHYGIQLTMPPYTKDSVITLMKGNQNNVLSIAVTKYLNGNIIYNQLESHTVYCTSFDTTRHQINY